MDGCLYWGLSDWNFDVFVLIWLCVSKLSKNSFVNNILWYASPCSMRHCFKSLVSRHFHRNYLKANKVSKSEGTGKVEYAYAYTFWKCADAFYPKLSKSVHACPNYNLTKLARFFETQCIWQINSNNNDKHLFNWTCYVVQIWWVFDVLEHDFPIPLHLNRMELYRPTY